MIYLNESPDFPKPFSRDGEEITTRMKNEEI